MRPNDETQLRCNFPYLRLDEKCKLEQSKSHEQDKNKVVY